MPKAELKKINSQSEPSGQSIERVGGGWLRRLLPAAIFLWPFIYLYPMVVAINGSYRAIGNDFILLYYKYKVYLLDNLANLNLPLWSPSEGAGYPFYSSPFTQTFYPFNIPLAVLYKILGGYTALDHQIFAVFGIGIFALGLYMWLRLLNSNLRAVIFATLIMSVSFKVTEILRFPNAVHTAAWYPWILYSVTRIIFSQSGKGTAISGALLFFSLICLCTGGYPYYIYYSGFLLAPYLLIFVVRPLRVRVFGERQIYWKRAVTVLVLAAFAAGCICGPYILAIKDLMAQTVDRGGQDYDYSVHHTFGLQDTMGSLVYPPAASPEGWYFFSVVAVLIIFFYLFCSWPKAAEHEKQYDTTISLSHYGDIWVKIFFLVWIGLITYISYGRQSYLFLLLWKCLPGFSSLRVWPRLNIILVPILAWLLSLSYASFDARISGKDISNEVRTKWKKAAALITIAIVYGVIFAIQFYFYKDKIYDYHWPQYFQNVSSTDIWFLVYGAVACVVILLLLAVSWLKPFESNLILGITLAGLVSVATLETRPVSSHMWTIGNYPAGAHTPLDVAKLNKTSFAYPRIEIRNTITMTPYFNVGTVGNWYFNRYVSFLKNTTNELTARSILLGLMDGRKVFFSKSIDYPTVEAFLADSSQYPQPGYLLSYTGDELRWEIIAPIDGYLSFIDNWCDGWKVSIDDKPVEMKLLFGTFKSIHLSAGFHRVRFFYTPTFVKW